MQFYDLVKFVYFQVRALISKLNAEKAAAVQQSNKLRKELVRHSFFIIIYLFDCVFCFQIYFWPEFVFGTLALQNCVGEFQFLNVGYDKLKIDLFSFNQNPHFPKL